ncbi:MAG: iron-sulfur cluster assembly scaffold protein [Desulfobacterales bacterium]
MVDHLDDFIHRLQERIFEETRDSYGELGFQRWRKPLYRGVIDNADGHGRLTGSCGDTMQIYLKFENGRVSDASFMTDGCGGSTVCGSLAAELAFGKTVDELMEVTGDTILEILGRFPEEDRHCAFLAAQTVQEALCDFVRKQDLLKDAAPPDGQDAPA